MQKCLKSIGRMKTEKKMKKYNYYGVLKGFDFKKINAVNFLKLIEKNLFDVYELSEIYKKPGEYFGLELEKIDWVFSDFFLFNGKEYHLKNEVFLEMYNFKNNFIEDFNDLESIYNEIYLAIEKEFQTENKMKVIEKYYNEYFSIVKNSDYYLLYKEGIRTKGYHSWFQYFKSDIVEEEDFTSVENFLKGVSSFLNSKINEEWNTFYIVSKVCDFCSKKRKEIENPSKNEISSNEGLTNKSNKNEIMDTSKQVLLLEAIIASPKWGNLSATKKGEIVSLLIGKNKDNIRNVYLQLDKPNSEMSQKIKDDMNEINKLI